MLALRRPSGGISTPRQEADAYRIISGVVNNRTTGTPLTILIPNENVNSDDYAEMRTVARPSHADYTAECKYHGYQDHRGGGHFSGRITAALVAAGAIAISVLRQNGILIGTHISRISDISDRSFASYESDIETLADLSFPVLDHTKAGLMRACIEDAASEGDSVGGILETAIIGLPAGIGEPWFDTVEGLLSHALFSIPAIKGVEFGTGFGMADLRGSQANDAFCAENGRVITKTNHNGGINGGITNGMPVIFRCAVKPTPSIFCEQESIDLATGKNTALTLAGRHDPAIIHRAKVVVDAMSAIVLVDMLSQQFGKEYFKNK
jgi:chorismate synthase